MSEKMTRIRLRETRLGFMEWGEHSFEEMVSQLQDKARRDLAEAQRVLAATPSDFEVAIVLGPYVQHFVRNVEPKD
jgi:hypothetical protein